MTTEDQELKKAGLKVTLPRVKILQILENCPDRHMTAEDIYQSLRDADEYRARAVVQEHHLNDVCGMLEAFDHLFLIRTRCYREDVLRGGLGVLQVYQRHRKQRNLLLG